MVYRRAVELGDCIFRVPVPSSRQPARLHRVESGAVEDCAGGHHSFRVRSLCLAVYASALEARFSVGWNLFDWRGLFHVPFLNQSGVWHSKKGGQGETSNYPTGVLDAPKLKVIVSLVVCS